MDAALEIGEAGTSLVKADGEVLKVPAEPDEGESEQSFSKRKVAINNMIAKTLGTAYMRQAVSQSYTPKPEVMEFRGCVVSIEAVGAPVTVQPSNSAPRTRSVTIKVDTKDGHRLHSILYGSGESFSATGLLGRLNAVFTTRLPKRKQTLIDNIPLNEEALADAKIRRHAPFPHKDQLDAAKDRLSEVMAELDMSDVEREPVQEQAVGRAA